MDESGEACGHYMRFQEECLGVELVGVSSVGWLVDVVGSEILGEEMLVGSAVTSFLETCCHSE